MTYNISSAFCLYLTTCTMLALGGDGSQTQQMHECATNHNDNKKTTLE